MDKIDKPDLTPDEPATLGQWFASNATSLAMTLGVIAFFCYKWDPLTVVKVAVGLGLVIFIHELGHFLAAKWCDVYVETFSIGFGPSVPGCRYTVGETTYMLALIPLGGYVKMLGEGDGEDGEEENPRSFKNKSVPARMLIISAGVIMNVLLAAACFVFVYMVRGVEEKPAVVGSAHAGSPAWIKGIPAGAVIEQIGEKRKPFFDDIRNQLMRAGKGEGVKVVYRAPGETTPREVILEPTTDREESPIPMIGVVSTQKLTLMALGPNENPPAQPDSAASRAEPPVQNEDRITACSDPAAGGQVTPLPPDPNEPTQPDYFTFLRRQQQMAGKPFTLRLNRDGQEVESTLPPAYTVTLGARMRMGPVVAVRDGSPAALAGLKPRGAEGQDAPGDIIAGAEVLNPDGTARLKLSDTPNAEKGEKQLDPARLPYDLLAATADKPEGVKVKLTVRRLREHSEKREEVTLDWDERWRYLRDSQMGPNSPLSLSCLGLCYRVRNIVDGVSPGSPLREGDIVKEVQAKIRLPKGKTREAWIALKDDQWAYFSYALQFADFRTFRCKVERNNAVEEVETVAQEDPTWPAFERGLNLQGATRLMKAQSIGEALTMGAERTWNTITLIYSNLRAMVVGRVSLWSLSGPLTIATVSYKIAGEDLFQFILFIGMINVNLAVINFLPIPVLDGGHMVFLIYELVRGKPANERVRLAATFSGLAFILCLMGFVIFLDVKRLFF